MVGSELMSIRVVGPGLSLNVQAQDLGMTYIMGIRSMSTGDGVSSGAWTCLTRSLGPSLQRMTDPDTPGLGYPEGSVSPCPGYKES